MKIEDLSDNVYAPEMHKGAKTKAVGWLGDEVTDVGNIDLQYLSQLKSYKEHHSEYDGDSGEHICQICNVHSESGEFWIESGGVRYVLPRMIIHYIEKHHYLPPQEFLDALQIVSS